MCECSWGLAHAQLRVTIAKDFCTAIHTCLPRFASLQIKKQLIGRGIVTPGTASGVLISSLSSGLLCALTTSPLDVVKSRVMGQPVGPDGKGLLYKGMLDCFAKVGGAGWWLVVTRPSVPSVAPFTSPASVVVG